MAKIIVWLVVILVVMLALRIVNVRNARRRAREQTSQPAAAKGGEPMVRCIRCGTYLPQAEARSVRDGYACIAGECAAHA